MHRQGETEGGSPLDSDSEYELGFSRNVEVAFLLREAGQANLLALRIAIFLDVGFCFFEYRSTFLLLGLQ